jgi:hypothetical protein
MKIGAQRVDSTAHLGTIPNGTFARDASRSLLALGQVSPAPMPFSFPWTPQLSRTFAGPE